MWFEGFEDQSRPFLQALGWTFPDGGATISTSWSHKNARGQGGAASLQCNGTNGALTPLFAVQHRYFYEVARRNETAGSHKIVGFELSGGAAASIQWNALGQIEIRRGTSTVIATSALAYGANTGDELYVEVDAICQNAAGSIVVYANNNPVSAVSFAGDTTANAADGWNSLEFGNVLNNFSADDLIIRTAAEGRLGYEPYVVRTLVNGNGTPLDFTSSSGNPNWQNVDETIPSTTDYNEGTVAGQADSYTWSPLAFTPTTITSSKDVAYVTRDGVLTQGRLRRKVSGVTYNGTWNVLGASAVWVGIEQYWNTNPNTGTAWTKATLDGIESQIEFQ